MIAWNDEADANTEFLIPGTLGTALVDCCPVVTQVEPLQDPHEGCHLDL